VSKASDIWNAQPFGVRKRLNGVMLERQILDYELEISRAKAAHAKHMKEVRQHLANVKASYAKWEQEYIDAGAMREGKDA